MPKVTGLERINEERELLRLLRKLYEAQRTQPDRKCVASFIRRLQQEPTEKASKATTLCISTEQALWMKDNDEHSYRSVHRLLCAGTHFNAVPTASKAECVKDFERLLGHFWTLTDFPVKRGRLFIAGVLSYMLDRQVSLVDIKNWFPTPNSQKMTISEELCTLLRERGVTWPPNANAFEQCTTYRKVKSSSSQTWVGTRTSSAAVADPNFDLCPALASHAFPGLHPVAPYFTPEVVEEASSSNHMQLATAAFQEGAAISASASSMQHAEWEALGPADFTTPPWLSDSALSLPSANTVDVDLDVYGSGVSCGELACFDDEYLS